MCVRKVCQGIQHRVQEGKRLGLLWKVGGGEVCDGCFESSMADLTVPMLALCPQFKVTVREIMIAEYDMGPTKQPVAICPTSRPAFMQAL